MKTYLRILRHRWANATAANRIGIVCGGIVLSPMLLVMAPASLLAWFAYCFIDFLGSFGARQD